MSVKLTTAKFIEVSIKKHGQKYDYTETVYVNALTKVVVICPTHGRFTQKPSAHSRGVGCAECSGNRPLTTETFITKSKLNHPKPYDYSEAVYVNQKTKVKLTCPEGHTIEQNPYSHMSGIGCAVCAGIAQMDTATFIEKAVIRHGHRYDYSLVNYSKAALPVDIQCSDHGKFTQVAAQHLYGNGCPKCKGYNKTTEEFVEEATIVHEGKYDYSESVYTGSRDKVKITCDNGHIFTQDPHSHLKGRGCPRCSGVGKHTTESFINRSNRVHGNRYDYSSVTYGKNKNCIITITCDDNHTFKQSAGAHLGGAGCPECSKVVSREERLIFDLFPMFERSNRTLVKPKEIDLYSPDHSLAIEVDGMYWHTEAQGKDRRYHLAKTEICMSKGVTLLHFWDTEVNTKLPIIQSMISSRMGKSNKIFARKTEIIKPSKLEVSEFLEANHLQGKCRSSNDYGLTLDGELVGVMTFGKSRFAKDSQWEIIRFATKLGNNILGGASKLFKAFVNEHDPESIITYADRRYSEGKVYEVLGFEFSHNSPPNYFYFKAKKTFSRYVAQKHKLQDLLGDGFNPEESEKVNMLTNGYSRVYDCGNKVFKWRST